MSEPLVIIGNGMAAARLVDELSKRALGRYAIAVIGEEPRLAYNRVLLSSVLAGEMRQQEIELKPAAWWREHGVTLRYGCAAVSIDIARKSVALENGATIPFSRLVFATGSRAIRLDIPGAGLRGVHVFRDSRDTEELRRLGMEGRKAVVIGGGLLGLEAAYGLVKSGARVVLAHLMDRLMERQLDAAAAAMLLRSVERKGIDVRLNANTTRIHGEDAVRAVELSDGTVIDADAVVFAAGVRPNASLAQKAGVVTNRGIVVDDRLMTSVDCVYAIGECAEHRGVCYGLVEPAYEQARVLAACLAGREVRYEGSVVATNLKVSGVNVFSAGDFLGGEGAEVVVWSDPGMGMYKKLVVANDRLSGAALIGDTTAASWYLELIRSGENVNAFRDDLAFGRSANEQRAA